MVVANHFVYIGVANVDVANGFVYIDFANVDVANGFVYIDSENVAVAKVLGVSEKQKTISVYYSNAKLLRTCLQTFSSYRSRDPGEGRERNCLSVVISIRRAVVLRGQRARCIFVHSLPYFSFPV